MSKIVDALNKVKEERRRQTAPQILQSRAGTVVRRDIRQILTVVLLAAVIFASAAVNVYMIRQMGESRAGTGALAGLIQSQNQELRELREDLSRERRESQREVVRLKDEVQELKLASAQVEDLRVDNRLLLEKYIALNDQVRKISETNTVNSK